MRIAMNPITYWVAFVFVRIGGLFLATGRIGRAGQAIGRTRSAGLLPPVG
jgi:hypothetical protein